jgi:sialate O-acetylesterase
MKRNIFSFIIVLLANCGAFCNIKLPAFFSDHMVFQRDKPIMVYGYAHFEKEVKVILAGEEKTAEIDKLGFFNVEFGPKSIESGPLKLIVKGSQTIEINDILIGDVFIVGGQSNMEWPVSQINNSKKELADADYPLIRLFTVPKSINTKSTYDLSAAGWEKANSESVAEFSAIGFLVARQLHLEKKIPIGVIDNAWGGTNIMGWLPEEAMANMPKYEAMITEFKKLHRNDMNITDAREEWLQGLALADQGLYKGWPLPEMTKNEWKDIKVPGLWEGQGYPNKDGIFWYALDINFDQLPNDNCTFSLGQIDDSDMTYLNGIAIGNTENAYNVFRKYLVDKQAIIKGKNHLVVRVTDTGGGGGIYGISDSLYCKCGDKKISLVGQWKFAEGTEGYQEFPKTYDTNAYPTNRYNGMVHPLTGLATKGYLYYQGESDASNAIEYADMLKRMIMSYRSNFGDQEMPFVIVQLANFMKLDENPIESDWAELRRSQALATKLPFTGMVCTIDVGEADDIHPRDKQTVAKRAVSVLKRIAYNEQTLFDGPKLEKLNQTGLGIMLTFDNLGEGLSIKGDINNINGFVVKTTGGKLIKVNAKRQSRTSVLLEYNGAVSHIRYLWANNPGEVQIYNSAGFPAEPFEHKM